MFSKSPLVAGKRVIFAGQSAAAGADVVAMRLLPRKSRL
jgi:hypothetical protein